MPARTCRGSWNSLRLAWQRRIDDGHQARHGAGDGSSLLPGPAQLAESIQAAQCWNAHANGLLAVQAGLKR